MSTVKNSGVRAMLLALAAATLAALLCSGGGIALADEGAGAPAGSLAAGDLAGHEADGDLTGTGEASGDAYAKFDSGTGTLMFFRSANEYTTGQTETYLDNEDNTQTITYYADIETTDWPASTSGSPKWHNEYRTLTRVVFEDEIAPISTAMWFYGMSNIENIEGMENLDTSNVTNMWYMFYGCQKLSGLDVSHMDVSNVKRFDSMFTGCRGLTELDVSGFDTSQAESLAQMFDSCDALTELDVSGFNTSNVTDMSYMFKGCMHLTELDVSGFNTSKVENMTAMFAYCELLESLDVSRFDTSHVVNMKNMFQLCYSLTELDLSGWDTSKVTSMDAMFDGCSRLTSLDMSDFDTSNVESMRNMFNSCSRLPELNVSHFDVSHVKNFSQMFTYCNALTTLDLTEWNTSNAENMASMFEDCGNLVSLNMSDLDTSHVTYFSLMFKKCSSLSNLNLSGIDTSGATDMRQMFYGCSNLSNLDLSDFNTSNVAYVQDMFNGCSSLTTLNLSGWDTSNVTTMANMFYGCESLSGLDVSGFVTSSVTDMSAMFYECKGLTSLDLSGFNTSNVTSMAAMFYGCQFTALDLFAFDTSKVTNMARVFRNCDKLVELDISSFDTSKVEDIYGMLYGCSSLEAIKLGAKTLLSNNIDLPVREWQLRSLGEPPVRYNALGDFDGTNPGWYLKGYRDLTVEGLVDAEYTGEPITQTPTVSMGDQALEAEVDYKLSYADNTNAGTATVTIAGMGDWVGSTTRTFEIFPKPIEPTLILSQETFAYNGSAQTPEVTVKDGETVLVAGDDYDVAFADGCKDVGTYPIAVTLKGNYSGSATSAFEIVTNETTPTVTLSPTTFVFDGAEKAPQVTVHDGDGILIAAEDYDVTFSDGCKDVGSYKAAVTLKGGYSGSGEATFEIIAKEIEPTIVLSPSTFTYDGATKTPEITVRDGEKALVAGDDYDVALPNDCKDAGTYDIEVALKGNYSGNASATFEICPKETTPTVALMQTEYVYDGTEKMPNATVRDGTVTLVEGVDYDVVYSAGRMNAGTYSATVTLKGNYSGAANATFKIAPKAVAPTVALSQSSYIYDGKAKTPAVTVRDGSKALAKGVDYDVAYSANTNAGTASVKVALKGNYAGTGSASFAIAKAANTMSAKGRTATVKHSKAKKKVQTVKASKAFTVKKAQGKVTYKVAKWGKNAKKYVKVSKAGKVTVKKGARKGTYTLKVKVTAAGNVNYKAKSKTVTLKVRVK